MRSLLLWGSRSRTLREFFPKYRFMRRAVTRFMPGESIEDALNAAEVLKSSGISAIVTHLGENLLHESEARTVVHHYLDVLERIKRRGLDCHISVKLTQLGLDLSQDLCVAYLFDILQQANDLGNVVWIDMESSAYVDRTLSIFKQVSTKYSNVGVCLQSYLYRTGRDLEALLSLSSSIRLVKGTYAEPKNVAFHKKREVDENFFTLATGLLDKTGQDTSRKNRMIIGIATHDVTLLQKIFQRASQLGIPKESFEIQMLYGIQREQQLRLAREGYRVRVLISYGIFWFPWYLRRLAERPANVLFVMKNIFTK